MARPGYLSLYADERTRQIFDEFVKVKGVSKTTALTEMLEIYMFCTDEQLYLELKKKALGIAAAKEALTQRMGSDEPSDFIFIKLGTSRDVWGNALDGRETMAAYTRACEEHGSTWFSTQSLHFGMDAKKVARYNRRIANGGTVKMLFAIGGDVNDICYSAVVQKIVSGKEPFTCPEEDGSAPEEFGEHEQARIWIRLTDIQEETRLKAAMLQVGSKKSNLKEVISNSQFHFGYVYLAESED